MLLKAHHRYIFLIGTCGILIGLPLSPFLLSISQLILSLNWIIELNYKEKLYKIWNRKSILLLSSVYIVHVIGLLNTSDYNYALNDLKIKLPLLALPIIFGTSDPLTFREFKFMINLFLGSVIISSLVSTFVLFGFTKIILVDSRLASIIINHIRLSLLVVLSFYLMFYFLLFLNHVITSYEKITYTFCMLWMVIFLFLLNALTGIVIFLILLPFSIIWWAIKSNNKYIYKWSLVITFLILFILIFYSVYSYQRFNKKYLTDIKHLKTFTVNGNQYVYSINDQNFENGHQIWVYICEPELRNEWNKRSQFKYDSLDRKGQALRVTLIRYLTSLGYYKDSVGISRLTREDIGMIEKGYTNYLYKNKIALYPRIYEFFWQFHMYKMNRNPNGQSVTQRIEYFNTGVRMLEKFFWFGTGTGDIDNEFQAQYEKDKSLLLPVFRNRSHNQFLTFFITFGLFGFIFICFSFIYSPFLEKKYGNYLFCIFFLISILSMLDDDTLETQAGVTFFAFFFSFFLYSFSDTTKLIDDKTS